MRHSWRYESRKLERTGQVHPTSRHIKCATSAPSQARNTGALRPGLAELLGRPRADLPMCLARQCAFRAPPDGCAQAGARSGIRGPKRPQQEHFSERGVDSGRGQDTRELPTRIRCTGIVSKRLDAGLLSLSATAERACDAVAVHVLHHPGATGFPAPTNLNVAIDGDEMPKVRVLPVPMKFVARGEP